MFLRSILFSWLRPSRKRYDHLWEISGIPTAPKQFPSKHQARPQFQPPLRKQRQAQLRHH